MVGRWSLSFVDGTRARIVVFDEEYLDIVVQRVLVVFHSQQMVSTATDDGIGAVSLELSAVITALSARSPSVE